jgi:hypothetical protein
VHNALRHTYSVCATSRYHSTIPKFETLSMGGCGSKPFFTESSLTPRRSICSLRVELTPRHRTRSGPVVRFNGIVPHLTFYRKAPSYSAASGILIRPWREIVSKYWQGRNQPPKASISSSHNNESVGMYGVVFYANACSFTPVLGCDHSRPDRLWRIWRILTAYRNEALNTL